jgi:multiple sugar transport system ATP-binding protein
MRDGRVEQIGRPLDLYDNPANKFVAGFIGSPAMNFIDGRVTNGHFLTADGTTLPLPGSAKLTEGTSITYGIRPEHFRVDPNGFAVRVQVVEPMGSETQIVVRLGSQDLTCLFRERVAPRPGETLMLAVDPEQVRLFDASSGAALQA